VRDIRPDAKIQCCDVQITRKDEQAARLQGDRDHCRQACDVKNTGQGRVPQLGPEHRDRCRCQQRRRTIAHRLQPWDEAGRQPVRLIGGRTGQRIGNKDQRPTHAQREQPVSPPRLNAGTLSGARAIERQRAEMLGAEVISRSGIIQDGQTCETLQPRQRQRAVGRQQNGKAHKRHQRRQQDKPHRLCC
jgi:hypothetical protein